MSTFLEVVEVSPNRAVSGHIGCIVSDESQEDCCEPVVVFPHVERDSNLFPHAVICLHHLDEAYSKITGELLAGGEPVPEDEEPEVITVPDDHVHEEVDPDELI